MRVPRTRLWRSAREAAAPPRITGGAPAGAAERGHAASAGSVTVPGASTAGPSFDKRLTREIPLPATPREAQLAVAASGHGARRTLALEGELSLGSVPILEAAIARAFARPLSALVLDLSALSFVDSSGLWTIVTLHKWCVREGVQFRVVPGSESIQQIFELTGLSDVIPFASPAAADPGAL